VEQEQEHLTLSDHPCEQKPQALEYDIYQPRDIYY
jgi:hypothetical protein